MRTKLLSAAAVLLILAAPAPGADTGVPDKGSLLAAWENAQKADPRNEAFEKTGEDSYRFKTRHFPYQGQLRVIDLVVEENTVELEGFTATGRVEVELPDLPPDFYQRHAASFGVWSRGNSFAWDAKGRRWAGMEEFSRAMARKYRCGSGSTVLSILGATWPFLLLLLFLLVLLPLSMRRYRRAVDRSLAGQEKSLARQEESMAKLEESLENGRRGLSQQQEMIRLLGEILAELKRR